MSENFTPQNGEAPSDDRPRLVLDTNTVLALWMFRDPKLEALRAWIEAGNCRLYSREDALEELRRVLAYRQFGLDEASQHAIHESYCGRTSVLQAQTDENDTPRFAALPACRDPDDQKFLEIALQAKATHLITRDKALQHVARRREVRNHFSVITPERFAAAMQRKTLVP